MKMNTKRKTLKMPVRYLMNTVLVALLFLGLSYLTGNLLSTYQNKVLMTVGINIILAVSLNVATGRAELHQRILDTAIEEQNEYRDQKQADR